ncbi:MAG TPA: L,D-transpeptidase [Beijerinckiaceae bacterium]|nr:L,D-transpeptidase [Beijerinckiaceae bacterium]
MRILPVILTLLCAAVLSARGAAAAVDIHVDLSTQTLRVHDHGETYVWPVSTARPGYVTPRGVYHPVSMQVMHYSHKYHNAPMPHSIFFLGGYAIHGTYETASLGRPVSHGCVRLSPAHAALLFSLVKADGARIDITGTPPRPRAIIARSRPRRAFAYVVGENERRPPVSVLREPYAPMDSESSRYSNGGSYRAYPSYTYGRVWTRDPFPR